MLIMCVFFGGGTCRKRRLMVSRRTSLCLPHTTTRLSDYQATMHKARHEVQTRKEAFKRGVSREDSRQRR
jgi:hypothetical protein